MALSNLKQQPATAGVPAPSAPTPEGTVGKGKKDSRHDKLVAQGKALRSNMTEEEKQLEGSKSDKVAFVGALGDPNKPQTRRAGKEDIPSLTVVGYAFKALEDMKVPRANLKHGFKNLMDVEDMTEETVKAGETFNLNIFETGALISRPEFAGTFTGEGTGVYLSVKFSQNREEPLPVLNKVGKGSVKENIIPIADMEGAGQGKKGTPKIKAEYADKFGVLYEARSIGSKGAKASKANGEVLKDISAAFQAYLKNR